MRGLFLLAFALLVLLADCGLAEAGILQRIRERRAGRHGACAPVPAANCAPAGFHFAPAPPVAGPCPGGKCPAQSFPVVVPNKAPTPMPKQK